MPQHPATAMRPVWDPLLRLFHWGLAAAFAVAWLYRREAAIHDMAGQVILGLLAFRIIWGFVGPASARFASFTAGPIATLRYAGQILLWRPPRHAGHNPAGAAMVVALLACLFVASASGLLMKTTRLWGHATVEWLHGLAAETALWLVAAHLVGVAVASLQHREALPLAMITGRKAVPPSTPRFLGWPAISGLGVYAGVSLVLLLGGGLLAARTALDAGLWRMPRMIVAAAKEAGCPAVSVETPRLQIYPSFRLAYTAQATPGRQAEFVLAGPDVFARRPKLDAVAIADMCKPKPTPASSASSS